MISTIESELNILEKANFSHLIPSHLLSCFKVDLNDRILPNLISDIDTLLQTVDANNFFKILSFKEAATTQDETTQGGGVNTSSNLSDNSFDGGKSTFVEISTRLCELLTKYQHELNEYLSLYERLKVIHGGKVKFQRRDELLIYQRAIFIQKLSNKHFELFSLLFRRVFDFYQKRSKDEANSNSHDESSPSMCETMDDNDGVDDAQQNFLNHPLIQNFLKINQIM